MSLSSSADSYKRSALLIPAEARATDQFESNILIAFVAIRHLTGEIMLQPSSAT
jgi:hypothetical protein